MVWVFMLLVVVLVALSAIIVSHVRAKRRAIEEARQKVAAIFRRHAHRGHSAKAS